MKMSEIKSCPFCGGPGATSIHLEIAAAQAGCADADCIGYQVAYDFVTPEAAIAAWNTRAQLAAPVAKQEPVGHFRQNPSGYYVQVLDGRNCAVPLYAAPQGAGHE
jgi:hypothetical protein